MDSLTEQDKDELVEVVLEYFSVDGEIDFDEQISGADLVGDLSVVNRQKDATAP